MGKWVNDGIVTIPAEHSFGEQDILEELGGLLGVGKRSDGKFHVADICTAKNINKWAKFKPIRHTKQSNLTDADRKGTTTDNTNGIFYGLKVEGGVLDGAINENMTQMHNATFEYQRPDGTTSAMYRIRDFGSVSLKDTVGYNHYTLPTLSGGFYLDENGDVKAYVNDGDHANAKVKYGLEVDVHFNVGDALFGVDILEMMNVQGVDLADTKAKSFPCILVTDAKGKSYFTALTARYDDNYMPKPIGVIESNKPTGWYVLIHKPIYSPNVVLNKSYPFTDPNSQSPTKATLFLYKSYSANEPLVVPDVNFHDYWIPLDTTLADTSARKIVIPDAIGYNMVLTTYKGVHFVVSNVTLLAVDSHPVFNIQLAENSGETTTNPISVTVTVTLDSGGTQSQTWNSGIGYDPNNSIMANPFVVVTFNDLMHISGTKYSGRISVSTSENGAPATVTSYIFNNLEVQ